MKGHKAIGHTLAHPRLDRGRLHPSRRRVLAAPGFGAAANQRKLADPLGFARPFLPSSPRPDTRLRAGGIGDFTVRRPAFSPAPWQNFAPNAPDCGQCSGWRALRVLAPSAIADAAIRRSLPVSSSFVRPFIPSSLSPKTLLRARPLMRSPRKPVPGLLEPPSPTDRAFLPSRSFSGVKRPPQDSTFSRKVRWRVADAHVPAVPARVRHASEGVTLFSNHHKTTAIERMALKLNTKTARIDLDISVEAQLRFAEIHKALGFKTKPETFEAIIYSVSHAGQN
jgi:hypothetical protein